MIIKKTNYFFWRIVALIVTRPAVRDWLINHAQKTPYTHITSADGSETYMGRWWLFNPYAPNTSGEGKRWAWLPSVRVHCIMRPDDDRHLHDHPWNARTIVLVGGYDEERLTAETSTAELLENAFYGAGDRVTMRRAEGYTGRLLFGQYHRISGVPRTGVWTLFITWKKRGEWGFLVDGKKVPWREYLKTYGQPEPK